MITAGLSFRRGCLLISTLAPRWVTSTQATLKAPPGTGSPAGPASGNSRGHLFYSQRPGVSSVTVPARGL